MGQRFNADDGVVLLFLQGSGWISGAKKDVCGRLFDGGLAVEVRRRWHASDRDSEFTIAIAGKPVPTVGAALWGSMFSAWQRSLDEQGGWLH